MCRLSSFPPLKKEREERRGETNGNGSVTFVIVRCKIDLPLT